MTGSEWSAKAPAITSQMAAALVPPTPMDRLSKASHFKSSALDESLDAADGGPQK